LRICDFTFGPEKRHEDEAEFVKASRQWFLANRTQLRINSGYSPNSLIPESKKFLLAMIPGLSVCASV
jgi:hypothetical protein